MRVYQICPKYFPSIGGVEEHVRNISERLAKKFEVYVLTTDSSGKLPKEEIMNGVYVRRFRSLAPSESYFFSLSLKKFLSTNFHGFGIIHAHSYGAFPALFAAQEKNNRKMVFSPHYHGSGHTFFRSLLHRPYKFFGKKIFDKADVIICVSNYERNLITQHFKINPTKLFVIPNGVNKNEFKNLQKRYKNHKVILSVCRLEKYKGLQYLIQSLPQLSDEIKLEIVGKGPYKESLVKLAKKLNVANRVMFYQDLSRAELLQKYADADVFALLSEHEAYGISVAEALCAGTPCIVTKTSALLEWIDNKNCFGVNYPICLDELVLLIKHVIGKKAIMPKIYDWDEITEKLAQIYQKL
ncbi:MAG: glycosyltransferase family 4 protein [Candidatus Bathyarchaeales archaeon]